MSRDSIAVPQENFQSFPNSALERRKIDEFLSKSQE